MKTTLLFFCLCLQALAQMPAGFSQHKIQVEGVEREFFLYAPEAAKKAATPVVFCFHGHGGSAKNAAKSFAMHRHWPEALSVYMQGLNTPGRLTDPEGKKPGWQHSVGDQKDRDLKFFDAVLTQLKADHQVDPKRVFSTGHSNGGGFTYLLWMARGEHFCAMAPSAAAARATRDQLKPKPVMHIAGTQDPLVKYAWQELQMNFLKTLHQCSAEGTAWAPHCTQYASPLGATVITYIHPGTHRFPDEAPALIARFFKECSQKVAAPAPKT